MVKSDLPVALTIAGSDSGGEAGIQADLKTFFAIKVHGTTTITCLTAQNPRTVSRLEPATPKMVRAQLEAIMGHFKPRAAKTGMLFSAAIVREVAQFAAENRRLSLVVDPVMISTSGRRLLQADAVAIVKNKLLPLAMLVTPNVAEAEILAGKKIRSVDNMREAAEIIFRTFGCAALVKGGHFPDTDTAVDFYHGPEGERIFAAARVAQVKLHGTGCTYSAAITAWLAHGKVQNKAIALAKQYITRRIHDAKAGLAVRRRNF